MKIKNLEVLSKKDTKPILQEIKDQWDAVVDFDEFVFLKNDKNRVFIVKRDVFDIDVERLRVNSLGIYLCEIGKGIRLSIEGSQMVGPKAIKNVFEISEEQVQQWLRGENLVVKDKNYSGFVIIKHKDDYLGTGKIKDCVVLNFVPKIRRLYN